MRGWFAAHDESTALAELKEAAIEGDIYALGAIKSDTAFDEQEAAALIEALEERVQRDRSEASAGKGNSGSRAYCGALARCNLIFPNAARWTALVDLLGDPAAFVEDKRVICEAIAESPHTLPPEVRSDLERLIDYAAANFRTFWPRAEAGGMALLLKMALGQIDGTDAEAAITRLAFGSHQERQDTCAILRTAVCGHRDLLLRVLLRDTDFAVRFYAAETVGYLAGAGVSDAVASLAWDLAQGDGRQLPLALMRGIRNATAEPGQLALAIADFMAAHASAAVRRQAERLQQDRRHPS